MVVIGELINGMYKAVSRAIADRDPEIIRHLAQDQVRNGARFLDINTGPYSKDPVADMQWLVETVQSACDAPLSLDSTRTDVLEAGLRIARKRAIINSTSADDDKMDAVFGLAKKYDAQVIGLAMDSSGIPAVKERRIELAARIIQKAIDTGVKPEDVYLDPIAMPVNVAQAQGAAVLESLREFRMLCDPAPQTTLGLSNVSQGAKSRAILDRTFLVMAIASGLTSAILDPLDRELMDAMITAELILNRNIYCDSFLEAYRKK